MWDTHSSSRLSQSKQSKATGPKPLRRSAWKDLKGMVMGVEGPSESYHITQSSHHKTKNVPQFPYESRALIVTIPLLLGYQQGTAALTPTPRTLGSFLLASEGGN